MQKLNKKRLLEVLKYIDSYIEEFRYPPNKQEISASLKMSNDSCKYYLNTLRNLGYITYIPNKPRTIGILKDYRELDYDHARA